MEKEGEPAKDEKKQKPKRRIGDRIKSPEKFTEQKMIPPRNWIKDAPKDEIYRLKEVTVIVRGAKDVRKGRHVRSTNPVLQFWVWTTRDLESFGGPHLKSTTLELDDKGDSLNPRWHWQNYIVEREEVMEKNGEETYYQNVYFLKLFDRHVVRGDRFLGEVRFSSEDIHTGKFPLGEEVTRPLQVESWVLKENHAHEPPERGKKRRQNKKIRGELILEVQLADLPNAAPLAFTG